MPTQIPVTTPGEDIERWLNEENNHNWASFTHGQTPMRSSMIMSAPSPSQCQSMMPFIQGNIQHALPPPMPHIYGTLATNHSFPGHYHNRPVVYTPLTHSPLRVFSDCAPARNQLGCTYSPGPIIQSVERMNLASSQSENAVSWTMTDNAPIQPSAKQVKEKKRRRYKSRKEKDTNPKFTQKDCSNICTYIED
ncbi:hypothetical protein O181_095785 [Austropuccinia psidii MF-1]|uniref:Uncharacterized protein n=1 Tax=Austropuccinia psidii MF-1 TaxID=1389203 RepID=A0A9Q3PCD9_9BASI|nr:hypothetical protein [Austropuccinia psidii MF-1]